MGTGLPPKRFFAVDPAKRLCLVTNAASGSNDAVALAQLQDDLLACAVEIVDHVTFPDADLPRPADLDAAGVTLVVVFAGDGTLNAVLNSLSGWTGAVLVLRGGTMNLLFHRLQGKDATTADAIAAMHAGTLVPIRPQVIQCAAGFAYAGLLAGPGTAWNQVREAMRESAVLDIAEGTFAALSETLEAAPVACREPVLGRAEGYPLLLLDPHDDGISVLAFHAEAPGEYLVQAWALLRRNFREGPHDHLGKVPKLTLASADGMPFGLLLDGEPAQAEASCTFQLAPSKVDLLTSLANG